jgi:hypothetical protein
MGQKNSIRANVCNLSADPQVRGKKTQKNFACGDLF